MLMASHPRWQKALLLRASWALTQQGPAGGTGSLEMWAVPNQGLGAQKCCSQHTEQREEKQHCCPGQRVGNRGLQGEAVCGPRKVTSSCLQLEPL